MMGLSLTLILMGLSYDDIIINMYWVNGDS